MFTGQSNAEIDLKTVAGMWLLDKDKEAKDSSPNGNNGSIEGATLVEGKFGKALEFDGVDNHVNCGSDESLAITDAITIMAWVRPESLGDYEAIVEKFDWVADKGGYVLRLMATGQVSLRLVLSDADAFTFVSNGAVSVGEWYHLAGTYDGSQAEIWIDGVLDKQGKASGTITVTQDDLKIGWDNHADPRHFDGIIDDVAVFNVALTGAWINSIMARGLAVMSAVFPSGKLARAWGDIKVQ